MMLLQPAIYPESNALPLAPKTRPKKKLATHVVSFW